MRLVISGAFTDTFRDTVIATVRPRKITQINDQAYRFERIDYREGPQSIISRLCEAAVVDHAFIDDEVSFSTIGLVIMDMDSTLITIECIDELADYVGKKKEVSAITYAAMNNSALDFTESLRTRVALLGGASSDILQHVYDERLKISDGAYALVAAARRVNARTAIISGGFKYFTDRLSESLAIDESYANELEIKHGKLTGRLVTPIIGPVEKACLVKRMIASTRHLGPNTLVIGDGANDIPMMQLTPHSCAYRAKATVQQIAKYRVKYGSLQTVVDYFSDS